MSDKIIRLPQIRFAGFTDGWEQRKLGEILKEFSIKSKTEDEYTVLSSTNSGMEIRDGRVSGTSNLGYKIIEDGDLVLSPQNLWLGNINVNDIGKGLVSPSYRTFKFVDLDSQFIEPQLRLPRMLEEYKNASTQGASVVRRNLDLETFNQIPIRVPSWKEQKKIGSFFKQLDDTITLHQRKLELLKDTKKSLLQKMFPKDGSNVPEIRFAGFTDAWEQYKLIEVATYRNGKAHEKDISDSGDFVVVNSKFVSTNGKIRKFTNDQIEPLKKGEIAFVLSDVPNGKSIARTFLVPESNKFSLNQRIAGITPHENTNSYFLNELMNRNHYFLRFDDGIAQTNLSKKDVEEFEGFYPTVEEQGKIGKFFSNLNHFITLHQRELNSLENLKKSLLQQLFI